MKAPVTYERNFLPEDVATDWFARLWNELDWERRENVPRREYWSNLLGRDYTYGRGAGVRTYSHRGIHPLIEDARAMLAERTGVMFEGCFLNGYEHGKDALGWHADDDPGIDHSKPIAILTLYEGPVHIPSAKMIRQRPEDNPHIKEKARAIQFRPIDGGPATVEERYLAHGSLALMGAGMQHTHFHRIPKSGFITRPRISLTFRGLL